LFLFLATLPVQGSASVRTYYVQQVNPVARDTNPGTLNKPWKTIARAVQEAQPGDTVYIREGTYRESLMPVRSGEPGKPITFSGYKNEKAWIVGSEPVGGFKKEGKFWIKRPWQGWSWWINSNVEISRAPYGESARGEQVYLEGKPLQWVPAKVALVPGSFFWPKDGSELVLCLKDGQDPNRLNIEVPIRRFLVARHQSDSRPYTAKMARQWEKIKAMAARVKPADLIPIDYIQIKKLNFRYNRATLNRPAVVIAGNHWLFENNLVEWTNAYGIGIAGDDDIVRDNVTRFTGEGGITGTGWRALVEGNISLWDNIRHYYEYWGGAGFKAALAFGWHIKNQLTIAPIGSGIWFDVDADRTTIEDSVIIGQKTKANPGGIFYEISSNADIRNNVVFGLTSSFSPGRGIGGITDSTSHAVKVEGNVIISSDGGLQLGSGGRVGRRMVVDEKNNTVSYEPDYHYKAYDVTYSNNLSFHDHNYSLDVQDAGSASPESNNRFLNNIAVGRIGGPAVNWDGLHIQDYARLDNYTKLARGNKDFQDLKSAPGEVRARIDNAFSRIVKGLARAMPYIDGTLPPVKVGKVRLIRADVLMNPGVDIYYLQVNPKTIWILLNSQAKQVLLLRGAKKKVSLLNLTNGKKIKGEPEANSLLKLEVPWGVSLLTGVSETSNLGRYLNVSYRVGGKRVKRLRKGQKVELLIEVNNLTGRPVRFRFKIHNFKVEKNGRPAAVIEMKPSERKEIKVMGEPLFKGTEQIKPIEVSLESAISGKITKTILLNPMVIPRILYIEGEKLGIAVLERTLLANSPLKIDRAEQAVADIRDPVTGLGWQGPDDLSANIHLGWDRAGLYFLADVKDNMFKTNAKVPYQGDCVEMFLDLRKKDNLGSSQMNGLTQQFFFLPAGTKEPSKTGVTGKNAQEIKSFSYRTDSGYRIIASIPWKVITDKALVAGREIGIDFAIDDADGKAYRKAQLVWQGGEDDWRNPALWGRAILGEKFSLPQALQGHLLLTRSGGNNVDVFENVPGRGKHLYGFKLQWDGDIKDFRNFAAGIAVDKQGNLFFLDGRKNRRIRVVKEGTTSALTLVEDFMGKGFDAPYQAGSGLVVSSDGHIYVTGSHFGGLKEYGYKFLDDGTVKCKEEARLKIKARLYRPTLTLSPDERFIVLASDDNDDPVNGLYVIDAKTMQVVDKMGSGSGYIASPSFAAFSRDSRHLFITNEDPLLGAKDKITRTITRIRFDPETGKLKGPEKGNVAGEKAFVVVYYKSDNPDPGTAVWLSQFDDLVYDGVGKRLIVSTRSYLKGYTLFAFDPARLSRSPINLDDLSPYGRTGGRPVFDLVVSDFKN
jgi:hypothetical protein